jgi:hypothetical protein
VKAAAAAAAAAATAAATAAAAAAAAAETIGMNQQCSEQSFIPCEQLLSVRV